MNGKLVKKGRVISYGGLRCEVVKVRMGQLIGVPLDCFGKRCVSRTALHMECECVQVVA